MDVVLVAGWKIDQVEKIFRDEMPRFAATYQPPPPVKPEVDAETFAKTFNVAAVGGAAFIVKDGRLSMRSSLSTDLTMAPTR